MISGKTIIESERETTPYLSAPSVWSRVNAGASFLPTANHMLVHITRESSNQKFIASSTSARPLEDGTILVANTRPATITVDVGSSGESDIDNASETSGSGSDISEASIDRPTLAVEVGSSGESYTNVPHTLGVSVGSSGESDILS